MEKAEGEPSTSEAGYADDAAELAALDAEIARLSLRRDQLLARLGSAAKSEFPAPAAGASTDGAGASTGATVSSGSTVSTGAPISTGATVSTGGTALAKADWYPDPFARYQWRYWNGSEWTDSVARDGKTYQDPPVWITSSAPTPTSPSTSATQPVRTDSGPSTEPARTAPSTASTPSTPSTTGVSDTPVFSGGSTPPSWSSTAAEPARTRPDIDVGKLILVVGAALLIGGLAGLTVWLWSRIGAVGRLGLLGLAAAIQIVFAVRIRERLKAAAEAFATTGAATLLFAVGSVGWTAEWRGTVGVVVGAVGVMLLLFARFRAWIIAGHLAIAVGAISVLVVEPWSQTALIIAGVIWAVRWLVVRTEGSFRPRDVDVLPAWLTASALGALLAAPALAFFQFDTVSTAVVFTLVALAVSEVAVRGRTSPIERAISLVAGAVTAVAGVAWSASLWPDGERSEGLVGLWVTGVVALLLWRAGRTEETLRPVLTSLAVGLVPFAVRFATDSASDNELIVFGGIMAVVGLAAARFVESRLSLWFWTAAVVASVAATEQLALWPRLALATIALASAAQITKLDALRYVAAATATATVADLLYGDVFTVSWWFRPDLVGASAAVFLFVAVRTRSTTGSVRLGNWEVPRYWESAVALLAVPVATVVSQPELGDLGSESLWRIGFIGALLVGSWAYGAVRRARPNALQVVSLLAIAVMVVSRVGDQSAAVRTGAWTIIGCLVTAVFAWLAWSRKVDELRYVAAATATATVANVLYGDLFTVSWWFRPDLVGAAAAVFLFVAVRTRTTPGTVRLGTWEVPRYWESAVALLAVPVGAVASQPELGELGSASLWRLGFVGVLLVGSWAYGAARRTTPNALQMVSLVSAVVVTVSRIGDQSAAVRTGAWTIIGCLVTIVFAWLAWSRKVDEMRYVAAATATATVANVLYGDLFTVSWWFRPDLVGAAAAVFLFVAVRTRTTPGTVRLGTWEVPRYWESAVALLVVPVATVVSEPAFAKLESASMWRLGFIGVLLVGSWAYGAARRTIPNALQAMSLLATIVVLVSRVGDESDAMRAGGWVAIGVLFVVAALIFRRVELLLPAAGSWMLVVYLFSPPGPLEVLTCSMAAVVALVAAIGRRFGRTGTFDFIPATALALVPSTFAAAGAVLDGTVDSEQVTRIVVVVLVGAVALTIGTYRRMAALVGPAVVALVVLAAAQLIVVQRNTSGWVSALVAGVLLLLVGTRLEYLRSVSRRTGDLVRSLR